MMAIVVATALELPDDAADVVAGVCAATLGAELDASLSETEA